MAKFAAQGSNGCTRRKTHTQTHTHTHTHTHTNLHISIHPHVQMYMHACMFTYLRTKAGQQKGLKTRHQAERQGACPLQPMHERGQTLPMPARLHSCLQVYSGRRMEPPPRRLQLQRGHLSCRHFCPLQLSRRERALLMHPKRRSPQRHRRRRQRDHP